MSLATSDDLIRKVLSEVRTIAVVGASINEDRPSHNVTKFLIAQGYNVIPVNPGQAGKDIAGPAPLSANSQTFVSRSTWSIFFAQAHPSRPLSMKRSP